VICPKGTQSIHVMGIKVCLDVFQLQLTPVHYFRPARQRHQSTLGTYFGLLQTKDAGWWC
jgi:hypothetical protein